MLNLNIELKELKNGEFKATTFSNGNEVIGYGESEIECLKDLLFWVDGVNKENA